MTEPLAQPHSGLPFEASWDERRASYDRFRSLTLITKVIRLRRTPSLVKPALTS